MEGNLSREGVTRFPCFCSVMWSQHIHSSNVDYVSVIRDGNARVRVRGVHHPCEHVLTPVPAYELQ